VLLLDYDGTLAPLARDRRQALPYPRVRSALLTILTAPRATQIGIVSGRSVADLRRLVRLERVVELWGSHGLERLTVDGCWVGPAPSRDAKLFLDALATALAHKGLAPVVERKPYGLALHGRGAPQGLFEQARIEVRKRWLTGAAIAGLMPVEFDGGLELRPAGFHKGNVVEKVLEASGPGTAAAYLGDGRTDEDAFTAVSGRGLAVLVGSRPRPTRARAWLRPPEGVVEFLDEWGAACSAPIR
jgi:trehalose-phosphatase